MDKTGPFEFGMIGLGVMGRNLLLNVADYGFAVAGYDKDPGQVKLLEKEGGPKGVAGFANLSDFINSLKTPRAVMMLVPAGKIVDTVIESLVPLLDEGDLIIDGGNSKFTDTERRAAALKEEGLNFFGIGVSGGEKGARNGPSMMPGGDKQAYQHVSHIFEAISAKAEGEPCVTYIGPGGSGHFVKMVHNGIEYALMQLIAESYDILKRGLHLGNEKIHDIFKSWNDGELQSFLLEITVDILAYRNPETGGFLLEEIKDEAKSKGTGKWTSQFAMDLQTPVPSIDAAVSTRDLSKYKSLRIELGGIYKEEGTSFANSEDTDKLIEGLKKAFYFGTISIFAQGMHLLHSASMEYNYDLQLGEIAKIWRGGCIIRASFLNAIFSAFHANEKLEHLFLDDHIQSLLKASENSARTIVTMSMNCGLPIPVFTTALNYFDAISTARLPVNLIQAQRDYFGAHTYELIGKEGTFHTEWSNQT